jgi:hypothetical protein
VSCLHHPSDWGNSEGVIGQADAQGMGVGLMRPLTSGVFQRLMAQTFPQIDPLDVGRLLLNYVLSDPYVDVALSACASHATSRSTTPSLTTSTLASTCWICTSGTSVRDQFST